ncbi:hypothetical protein L861_15320 [Litchfieldella anticariensis FP35 = DSM 16096]|uniref:Uncharacterized protein n=1 Tax=Litchfieldella anticariensis (strain DSM 16096 / CECT 5854 / CIP 108499 / LMG 22089 / FP35) TaxID=1121939 RepID=S2KMF0_LITA3|nr:hypothetical protein [Halomonas anticariensis]EPC01653.1 hypothetical protein L861_15320 [Halomonas anticariensis FP35 = DSM 16096]
MTIQVTNNAQQEVEVAINEWGTGGDTSFFTLHQGKSEKWDRVDERGFVMAVKHRGAQRPYYVQHQSNINIYDHRVTDHDSIIRTID